MMTLTTILKRRVKRVNTAVKKYKWTKTKNWRKNYKWKNTDGGEKPVNPIVTQITPKRGRGQPWKYSLDETISATNQDKDKNGHKDGLRKKLKLGLRIQVMKRIMNQIKKSPSPSKKHKNDINEDEIQ